jgi:hypothetical protein
MAKKSQSDDDVIEGVAVETEPPHAPNTSDGDKISDSPEVSDGPKVSGNLVTIIPALLSVGAVIAVGYLYFDIQARHGTEPGVSPGVDPAIIRTMSKVLENANNQIGNLEARVQSMETSLAGLGRISDQAASSEVAGSEVASSEVAKEQSAFIQRLGALDQQVAALQQQLAASDALSDPSDQGQSGGEISGDKTFGSETFGGASGTDQLAILMVMGVLSDAAANRPLGRWLPALRNYADHLNVVSDGGVVSDISLATNAVIAAISAAPPSHDDLLRRADQIAAAMAVAVNDAGDNASILERATASLGKMVKLRSLDVGDDDPRGQLARFEQSVFLGDLPAAAALADSWTGPPIKGLADWRADANARLNMELAIADLAAALIGATS